MRVHLKFCLQILQWFHCCRLHFNGQTFRHCKSMWKGWNYRWIKVWMEFAC